MKITIWGINYAPEATGIGPYNTDLCGYLHESGHEVRMVTGFPYYPDWKKRTVDRMRLFRREKRQGVQVLRCWQYVPRHPNAWKRMLHEASFICSSFWRLLFTPRPDLLLVVSPPLLLGPAAWMAGLLKRCPFQVHVQDMQPDAAISLGLLKPGKLTRFLYRIEQFTCNRASRVSGITEGMLHMFAQKGVPAAKRFLLPNWIIPRRTAGTVAPEKNVTFRRHAGVSADDFLVVYSGNLGKKQGLEIVLDAADQLARTGNSNGIALVIAGEGAAKEELQARINDRKLSVTLLPLQPEPMFQAMLCEADLGLVTQQKGGGSLFFPSKLISLLAAGCPVLTVADEESELAVAVRDGGFGRNVLPGDSQALAAAIVELARRKENLPGLAEAGRRWIARFSRESVLGQFVEELRYFENPRKPLPSLAHE